MCGLHKKTNPMLMVQDSAALAGALQIPRTNLLLNILIQNEAWLWIIEFVTSMRWSDIITVGLEPNSLLRWKSPSGQDWEISVLLLVHVLYGAKLRAGSNVVAQT